MSLGKIPQVLKCATLMDKHKKQKNKDFPPRFEPEKNSSGFKMHLCFSSTWRISNPGNFFLAQTQVENLYYFCILCLPSTWCVQIPGANFWVQKQVGNPYFFVFYFCQSTQRILKPGEFPPDSNLGEESIFVFVFYFCHQHSAFETLGIFLGSKIAGKSLLFCFWNLQLLRPPPFFFVQIFEKKGGGGLTATH